MKRAYPIIIEPVQDVHPYVVSIPDLDIFTEGDSLYDAVDMARDAIGLFLVDRLDNVPDPSDIAMFRNALRKTLSSPSSTSTWPPTSASTIGVQ